MLAAVLKRDDMKARFLEIAEEQMEGALSPENFCRIIDEIAEIREEEVLVYKQDLAIKEEEEEGEDEPQEEILRESREELEEEEKILQNFARERPAYMREELKVLEDF